MAGRILVALSTLVVGHVSGARDEGQEPLEASWFAPYPGYTGHLAVAGTVRFGQDGNGTQVMFFNLSGTDPRCWSANVVRARNGCGLHIHRGTTCSDAGQVGDHYYSDALSEDPWEAITYTTVNGTAMGDNVHVTTGATLINVTGRTMVIHDINGTRVACALLQKEAFEDNPPFTVRSFTRYPGYLGILRVGGMTGIHPRPTFAPPLKLTGHCMSVMVLLS